MTGAYDEITNRIAAGRAVAGGQLMDKTELKMQTAIRFVEAMGANDPQTAGHYMPPTAWA